MSKNKGNLIIGSAAALFVLSLVNKGLGFVKSVTIASVFGATIQTDAYYVAEGLLQSVLLPVGESVAVSFLPIYIGIREQNQMEAKKFTNRTLTDFFLLALFLTGFFYCVSPVLLKLILPSYTAEEQSLTVSYFRILIWGMCLYMVNQLMQSLLNAEKAYGFSYFTAMLNNLILTIMVFFLGRRYGLMAMVAAVPISYLAQYVLLQAKCLPYGRLTFRQGFRDSRIWTICTQALPIFVGNAICELNIMVDKSLLSGMQEGSVTAVSYAAVLYQFASNMISIPVMTIIYTELSESFAAKRMEEGAGKLEKGLRMGVFFCIPLSLFVMVAAELIVQITYGRGAFDAVAVEMTSQGLCFYGLCFLAYYTNALLFRACYALGDTVLPMKVGMFTVTLNIVLSIVLSRFLGLRGIVLATALANTLTSAVTIVVFHRTKLALHLRALMKPGIRAFLVSCAATAACAAWLHAGITANGILLFAVAAVIEFGVYALLMLGLKDEMCLELLSYGKAFLRGRRG